MKSIIKGGVEVETYFLGDGQHLTGFLDGEPTGYGRVGAEDDKGFPTVGLLQQTAHGFDVGVGPDADSAVLEDVTVGIDQRGS